MARGGDVASAAAAAPSSKKCHHPLIQSPLRKHIKIVYDSACANASCTMLKAPFPLLLVPPPPLSPSHHSRQQPVEGATCDHMQTLDALTSTTTANIRNDGNDMGVKEGGQVNNGGSSSSTNKEEERAIDLLTSASFLFQQSRRKLG